MQKVVCIAGALWAGYMPEMVYGQTVQPQEYTIKLTAAEVDIVGRGLGKLPYEDVALIIQKLRQQIVDQQSAKPVDKDGK